MKTLRPLHLSLITAITLLTGCGGGGGGSSATLAPFTSWNSVAGRSVIASGISQSGTYTWNSSTDRITSRTIDSSRDGATYSATYGSSGEVLTATINPVNSAAISINRSTDTIGSLVINSDIDAAISPDGSTISLAANPYRNGWEYQSFGIWSTGGGTGSGTYGAISIGAQTAGAAIPTSGSATFFGIAGGRYIDSAGRYYFTGANMSASTNFATRSINFSTTGTQVTPDLINTTINNGLNMSGTLSYSAGTNQIAGNVSTTSGLSGTVNARFYGPSAQEIGGTFSVSGGGLEGYAGAFGGKR